MDHAKSAVLTRELLGDLFGTATPLVNVRLWDGTHWPDDAPRRATLVLGHPGALRSMFLPGTEVTLGEAYLFDDFDIEGDIEAAHALADQLRWLVADRMAALRLAPRLLRLPSHSGRGNTRRGRADLSGQEHCIERDRQAIAYHYDVSNDFYSLWLDRHMVYSCAYFASADDALDTAQEHKLDLICRKLRLRTGQRVLDLGCGWGGLALWAAERYGADVTGITLSQPQADEANARIAAAGLGEHCRVLVQDYRKVSDWGSYDALVSVGMFEHVGHTLLPTYFEQAWRLLKPQGVFLNHGIARTVTEPPEHGKTFSNTYVFPDGELVPISATLQVAEQCGFEVRDVESLREHYVLTLRHWVRRLEEHHQEALQYVDEPTYRVWRLYMSGSAHGFSTGRLNVYQTLLAKPAETGESGLPLTREAWYRP